MTPCTRNIRPALSPHTIDARLESGLVFAWDTEFPQARLLISSGAAGVADENSFIDFARPYRLVGLTLTTSFLCVGPTGAGPAGVIVTVGQNSRRIGISNSIGAIASQLFHTSGLEEHFSQSFNFGRAGISIRARNRISVYGFAPAANGFSLTQVFSVCNLQLIDP